MVKFKKKYFSKCIKWQGGDNNKNFKKNKYMYDSERRASNYFPATCKYMHVQYFSIHCQIKYQKINYYLEIESPKKKLGFERLIYFKFCQIFVAYI